MNWAKPTAPGICQHAQPASALLPYCPANDPQEDSNAPPPATATKTLATFISSTCPLHVLRRLPHSAEYG